MDGCIQGELHDDDQKAATALPVSSEVLSKMWGEFWIHAQGFGTNFFLNRDESLVRLAKAFAAKNMCLVFGYV
jgi:hypothetical protein